ncbi:MAG: DNA polymerase III subunit delta [Bacteroidales bacterium]|nr:DNA polymerase III subunit delta [Bacteroidales bacterium]
MAKGGVNIAQVCNDIISDVRNGVFAPVYLLMGDEPYYPELVCQAIVDNCLQDYEKDFNETICYGSDVTASQIITSARRFPMMAERQLVVVKEAQQMKGLEDLAIYCAEPLDTTVLVLLMHKASADKRKSLYKAVQKNGIVVDSPAIRDYEIGTWISSYYSARGLRIEPQAAALLGESAGTDLSVIVAETEKLLRNLPEGCKEVKVEDVEKNVGISRQFSVFELTRELSLKNSAKALKIATHIGTAAKFAMPMAVSALYTHFYRILKYEAALQKNPRMDQQERASILGVNPYFLREYDAAVRNYPIPSTMKVISMLCEFDYLGKGGDGATLAPDQLLIELTAKILNA